MRTHIQLDIRNVAAPYCLLMVKSTLASMGPGDVLEVQVADPASVNDLVVILDRSGDELVAKEQRANDTRLLVRKGSGMSPMCPVNSERATNG